MDQEDLDCINTNIEVLVKDMETSLIVRSLIAAGIFSDSDFDLIQAKSAGDEKNHELLAILKRRGPLAFQAFLIALGNAGPGQEHLLELMNRESLRTPSLSVSGIELDTVAQSSQSIACRQQKNEQLPEQGSPIDSGVPTSYVPSNDKMNKQFFETAVQAFEELTTKYFNTDYFQYETFKNWAVVKTEYDAKRRATTRVYRCKPQPLDEPYTLFGLKTELETSAELHFKDLLANHELESLENPEYESIKRIEWLGPQSDIIHTVLKDLNFFSPGREVVLARYWRKVNNAYIICNRSIETDKVPKTKKKIRYYTRFAAARYTPVPGNENQCVYEALVSGDPKGWISGWFTSIYNSILENLIINEAHLQHIKDDRINKCLRSDCRNRGLEMCLYCKNIYNFENSVFLSCSKPSNTTTINQSQIGSKNGPEYANQEGASKQTEDRPVTVKVFPTNANNSQAPCTSLPTSSQYKVEEREKLFQPQIKQSTPEPAGGRSAHSSASSMSQLNHGSDSASLVKEFDASCEMEKIIRKFDQLPPGKVSKLKRPLTPVLKNGVENSRIEMSTMVDLEDLVNIQMASVLPNSAVKKIRSAPQTSEAFSVFCEALTKSSIYGLFMFLVGLRSNKQEHLFHLFCTEEFCKELLRILD